MGLLILGALRVCENMQVRREQCSPWGQATPVNRPSVVNIMDYRRHSEQSDLIQTAAEAPKEFNFEFGSFTLE